MPQRSVAPRPDVELRLTVVRRIDAAEGRARRIADRLRHFRLGVFGGNGCELGDGGGVLREGERRVLAGVVKDVWRQSIAMSAAGAWRDETQRSIVNAGRF